MSILSFNREDTKVKISIEVDVPNRDTRIYFTRFECHDENYAGFLAQAFRDAVGDAVQNARRNAYEEGWKDAKAKRRKNTWFSRAI